MNYRDLSNEELLERYKSLDEKAFDEFYRRTHQILFSYIATHLRFRADADEVFQETFFRIHRYVLRFDPQQNALSWSFAIAKNCLRDHYRKSNRNQNLAEEARRQQVGETYESGWQVEARQDLDRLLSLIEPENRKLIYERYVNDRSYADLASELSVSEASLRKRVSRIMTSLKKKSNNNS